MYRPPPYDPTTDDDPLADIQRNKAYLERWGFKSEWGPRGWFYIHVSAKYFPSSPSTDELARIHAWFRQVYRIVPSSCRTGCVYHYRDYLDRISLPSTNFFEFSVQLHNHINLIRGKPIVSAASVEPFYTKDGDLF